IIDPKSEDCGLSFPVNPVSGPVSITSPASHAVISNTETVRGTVKLSPGQHLYLFDYSFGTCRYYFNPQGEVRSMHDGSWDAEPDLTGNIGEEQVEVVAVVVSAEADAAFREIDTYMHRRGDMSPFIFRLPDGADWVSIPVQVAAR